MRQLGPMLCHFLFGPPTLSDIYRNPPHSQRLVLIVEFDAPTCGEPALSTSRKHHTVFALEIASILRRFGDCLADRLPIIQMKRLEEMLEVQTIRVSETVEFPRFVGSPDFVAHNVPGPQPESRRTGRQFHAPFALAQIPSQLRRSQHVAAQFVSHRAYHN